MVLGLPSTVARILVPSSDVLTLAVEQNWVRPIGTKWVLKNKKDERGIVIRNKARLVAQGHTQEEWIDYDEVFAPVARIEAIRLFLAYASFMRFTVYQMDVKSAFLHGTIDEEVYVMQPPGFQDPEFPGKVYKVEKAMFRMDTMYPFHGYGVSMSHCSQFLVNLVSVVRTKPQRVKSRTLYRWKGIPTASDEFSLPEDFPTASEERFPLLRKSSYCNIVYRTPCPIKGVLRACREALIKRRFTPKYHPFSSQIHSEIEQPNPTFAKIPILDTGKFKIQQYFQNEHYALWEVIEFGDSYEAPQEVSDTGSASECSAKKKGRTVVVTIEDMQKRRNDVKARTTLLLALPDEHQLRFSKYKTAQELWVAILKTFGRNEATKKTKKNQLKQQYGNFKAEAKNSSGNREVNTASIPTASTQVSLASANIKYEDINQIDEDDIEEIDIKWNMALLSMRADRYWKKTGKKISIQGTDVAGFDKSKVKCFNCHKMGHFTRECRAPRSQDRGRRENFKQGSKVEESAPKALMVIDEVGWDWSYMANEEEAQALVADQEAPKEFALMAKSSSDTEVFDNSLCSKACKKNADSLNTKIIDLSEKLSDSKTMLYHYKLGLSQVEARLVEFKNQEIKFYKKIRGLEFSVESKNNRIKRLTNELEELKKEKEGLDSKLTGFQSASKDLDTLLGSQSDSSVSENGESSESIMSKPMIKFVKAADGSTVIKTNKDEIVRKPSVKYAEMYKKLQRVLMLGMTGNISYLSDYEPYDGGYVSFGQGGCKITGKGTIKTGKLEFENVYFVKDLKYNLFSVSQICDNKNSVLFTDLECIVLGRDFKLRDDTNVLLRTPRQHNMYSIDLNNIVSHKDLTCLVTKASTDESMIWHRRLGHLNFKIMNRLVRHNLVKGLPSKCFDNDHTCVACLKGKQHKASCKTNVVNSVTKPHHTLHMDLFGPTSISSLNHKWYCLVVTDDFSRTSQHNRVAERRNKTLIEAARTMLADAKLPVTFWAEAVNTTFYVQNRVLVNKSQNKTPYELFNGRTPVIGFLKPFRCHVMILNTLDHLGKFEAKGGEGYFIGYSMSSKAFRVFNKRTKRVEENLHVEFLENKLIEKGAGPNWLFDIDTLTNSMNYVPVMSAGTTSTNFSGTKEAASQDVKKDVSSLRYIVFQIGFMKHTWKLLQTLTVETLISTVSSPVLTACLDDSPQLSSDTRLISKRVTSQDDSPSLNNILTLSNRFEDILEVSTNSSDTNGMEADLSNMENNISASPTPTLRIHKDHPIKLHCINPSHDKSRSYTLLPILMFPIPEEPKKISDALKDPSSVEAMPIGTKWVLKNKKDKRGIVIRNKARLVAQGHTHEEGIDYEEVFAPVARIEAIRLFLDYASFMGFTVYQMDVKSAFLYGTIDEKVYVMQPPGFQDPEFPARVYKVEKAMYGLHQAARAWYGELNFFIGLQVLQKKDVIFLSQDKYVDDILKKFGYSDVRSMIGSLMYLTASGPDIMFAVCVCVRHQVTPKECHLHAVKRIFRYLKGHPKLGIWYPKDSPFDLVFWSTARIETMDEGTKILATVDGKPRTITESSIRRNLKLKDEARISSLPDAELFENLTLMGYNISPNQKFTFHKGQFFHQWKYLIHTIMQCLSPKSTGFNEFSSNIATVVGESSGTLTEPHHTPSPEAPQSPQHDLSSSTHPHVTTATIPTVIPTETSPLRQYTRRARIAQSSTLPTVPDEPAFPLGDDSQGEACLTISGLEAEQDRVNIIKTSTLPHDSTPRVTSLAADEGTQDLEIASLKARIKMLEDKDGGVAETYREDATIKGRSLETWEESTVEKSTERGSNDTEELVNILTSLDLANILTSGRVQVVSVSPVAEVPTSSGMVPTASPIFTTASVVTPYSRRKGKKDGGVRYTKEEEVTRAY
nr:hypothetical protein [Tanacetum cinerariifolium]